MTGPIVRISGLVKVFKTGHGLVRAVDGVDLEIARGETLALVGESGSGKSTLGRCVLRLVESDEGDVEIDGQDVRSLGRRALRHFRRNAQMVFQDPYGSLNPRMRVRDTLEEPLKLHTELTKAERHEKVAKTLELVRLAPSYATRFPGQLSGGEQQRVGIGRAVITEPKLIVLDEPTASLDARVRKGIYDLLEDLQSRMGLTYLLISHDLSSVWSASDRVAVMYMGQIVEQGTKERVFLTPGHPYTVGLMSAAPQITAPGTGRSQRLMLKGETMSAGDGKGCRFVERCPLAAEYCSEHRPGLSEIDDDHAAACFRIDDVPHELAEFRDTSHLASGEAGRA